VTGSDRAGTSNQRWCRGQNQAGRLILWFCVVLCVRRLRRPEGAHAPPEPSVAASWAVRHRSECDKV
jgi:hypothetical protein